MRPPCIVASCDAPNDTAGLCGKHCRRAKKGQPLEGTLFWWKFDRKIVARDNGCWLWAGTVGSTGYGQFGGSYAHRLSYQRHRGPIPPGLVIDHLCRVRLCVNPDHMEPVTLGENTRRGMGHAAVVGRTNRCLRGHEYTPENTYYRPDGRGRQCRECNQIRRRSRYVQERSA